MVRNVARSNRYARDYASTYSKVELIREGNAVAEVAKYSAKDYEMSVSQEVFDVFYLALKGRQLIVYGGLLKDYAKNMKMANWTSIRVQTRMNIIID